MRVEICSICKKPSWSVVNKICASCSFHIEKEKIVKAILKPAPVVERKPVNHPKKWTRETHPKPPPIDRQKEREEERQKNKKIFIEHKMFGYVYLIRSENGFYKIGLSKNVKQRLGMLQSQYPIQMGVIHSFACHDVRKVEKNLHKMFAKKRAQNEWFRLEPDDVSWIMAKKDYSLG